MTTAQITEAMDQLDDFITAHPGQMISLSVITALSEKIGIYSSHVANDGLNLLSLNMTSPAGKQSIEIFDYTSITGIVMVAL